MHASDDARTAAQSAAELVHMIVTFLASRKAPGTYDLNAHIFFFYLEKLTNYFVEHALL
jgi:hypothetical protein